MAGPSLSASDRAFLTAKAESLRQMSTGLLGHVEQIRQEVFNAKLLLHSRRYWDNDDLFISETQEASVGEGEAGTLPASMDQTNPTARGSLSPSSTASEWCLCGQPSFGEMIQCEREGCLNEWYHLGCLGMTAVPEGSWICPVCEEASGERAKADAGKNSNAEGKHR